MIFPLHFWIFNFKFEFNKCELFIVLEKSRRMQYERGSDEKKIYEVDAFRSELAGPGHCNGYLDWKSHFVLKKMTLKWQFLKFIWHYTRFCCLKLGNQIINRFKLPHDSGLTFILYLDTFNMLRWFHFSTFLNITKHYVALFWNYLNFKMYLIRKLTRAPFLWNNLKFCLHKFVVFFSFRSSFDYMIEVLGKCL